VTRDGLIVVGSGPAGLAAAETFRQHNDELPVRILTDDAFLPYARPPLSKDYLRGETDDVSLHEPRWFSDRSIEVVRGIDVEKLDLSDHCVIAGGGRHYYDALVLACGAIPAQLPVPGGDLALQLRSLGDADRLRKACADASSAVIVGAGFIGCEAAASLASQGVTVTLVAPESVPQEKRLGEQAGERLRRLVDAAGARFVGGISVEALNDGAVRLGNGVTIDCDVVIAATGAKPRSELGRAAGLDLAESQIIVGADMQTSRPGVYAAGDVAVALNTTAGRRIPVEHWQDAIDQGAIAGACAAGVEAKWDGVPGFWTTIGDATVKYHAWGDGYQHSRLLERKDGFTVWYEADGVAVGVLTCNADEDYELGERLIGASKPAPAPVAE
jgi:NADPH-dependent 2,4-dienoyl-CoA reductase/sulfur reductase-like enzyme